MKNMRLHNRLLLSYLIACIVPLLVVSTIIYNFATRSLEESAMEFASIFNSQIVTNIDEFIDEYDRVTKSALVDNDVLSNISREKEMSISEQIDQRLYLQKIMMRLMTLKPEIKEIMLITSNDKFYQFSNSGDSVKPSDLLEQEWLEKIQKSKDSLVVTSIHDRSYYDNQKDGTVLTVGRRIMDYRGAYFGVLLIDLDPSSLIELNDDFLLARSRYNMKISITDSAGGILYDSDVASGRMTWEQARESTFLFDKNSEDFIIMSNQTKRGNMLVNAVIPRASLLFRINKINYVAVAAVLTSTLIVIIVSFYLSRTITKPLKRLQQNMKQVEEGRYSVMLQNEVGGEIGSLIDSYNDMVKQIKMLIEDVYIAEIKQKNAKLLALQTQINPHMLYNTLESIRMKALMREEDEIADMIQILSKMFKMTLSNHTLPNRIQDEIEYTENYIKLQNLRFHNKFSLEVQIGEEIRQSAIIAMVFQPLIENSIEHGFRMNSTLIKIVMEGETVENGDIVIRISDNGKGMSKEKIKEVNSMISLADSDKLAIHSQAEKGRTSIGLKNIAERVKLSYGDGYYLKVVSSDAKGTVVEMRIPRQEN